MTMTNGNIIVGLGDGVLKIAAYDAAEGAAVDVGSTEGGITIEVPREYYEKKCDQSLGPIELIKIAEKAILKVNLAETTLAMLAVALDYPTTAVSGSTLAFGGDDTVTNRTLYINVKGPSGGTRKYTVHKAVCTGAASHAYKRDEKTMIECEFTILQDTAKTADQQLMSIVDTGADTTPPTVVLTTPADGGTVTKDAKGTVLWTITETNTMDESTIKYGNDDDATFMIINTTTPGSAAIVAGSIVYSAAAKTVTFTPDANWTASDTFQAIVTTGLKDSSGNRLAAVKIEQFSVTA